ncbi:hypothetical protein Cgig2_004286 [Carnegiea gigantea]|uniref:Protein kinase domain-containing protein n=1 Tax=Carnegiea gigantea TaxID=171969 RepID=A0A9Q1KF45_9CARY|nr:hypothetical protein Cgig2_004286 [Carnegiea gigantea]
MGNPGLCDSPILQVPPCPRLSNKKQKQSLILKIILPMVASGLLLLILTFFMMRQHKKNSGIPVQDDSHMIKSTRRISYFELLAATNQFGENNFIGAGAFGLIYRAVLLDGIEVVVNVFNTEVPEAFGNFDAECEILRNIRRRNLVQTISTIECLHRGYSTLVVRHDLKLSNVLLDDDMVAHISVFGLARLLDEGQLTILSNNFTTTGFVSTKADVYSYGILLIETFSRKKPTDSMFDADMSLKHWIHDECCGGGSLINVIDPKLLNEDGVD